MSSPTSPRGAVLRLGHGREYHLLPRGYLPHDPFARLLAPDFAALQLRFLWSEQTLRPSIDQAFWREGLVIPLVDARTFITDALRSERFRLFERIRLAPAGLLPVRPLEPGPPLPTPDPARPEVTPPTWFEIQAIDEYGAPIADVLFHLLLDSKTTPVRTDDEGRLRVDCRAGSRFASMRVADVRQVWNTLDQRDETERSGPVLESAENRSFLLLREPSAVPQTRLQLTKNTPHQVVFRRTPRVTRIRIRGPVFCDASTFLRPSATPALRDLVRRFEASPNASVLVVGHVYPPEVDEYSDELSQERARVVRERLAQDVDAWVRRYDAPDGSWDEVMDFLMARGLPEAPEVGVLPWFKRRYGRAHDLDPSSVGLDETTRRAIIAETMATPGTTLPSSARVVVHGCGGNLPPLEPAPKREYTVSLHGRWRERPRVELEFFVFERDIDLAPSSDTHSADYARWCDAATTTVDLEIEKGPPALLESPYLRDCPMLARVFEGEALLREGSDEPEAIRRVRLGLADAAPMMQVPAPETRIDLVGPFDATMETWVRRFQQSQGLVEDGLVGPRTLSSLDVLLQRVWQSAGAAELGATDHRSNGAKQIDGENVEFERVPYRPGMRLDYLGRKDPIQVRRLPQARPGEWGSTLSVLHIEYAITPKGRVALGTAWLEQRITIYENFRPISEFEPLYERYQAALRQAPLVPFSAKCLVPYNAGILQLSKSAEFRAFSTYSATYRHEAMHADTRDRAARLMMTVDDESPILSYPAFLLEVREGISSEDSFLRLSRDYWRTWGIETEALLSHELIYLLDVYHLAHEYEAYRREQR